MIETGRHKKIPKEKRFCPFCTDTVETETHFLLQCPTYGTMRDFLYKTVTESNSEFPSYTINRKLEYIMKNINRTTAKYIFNAIELRTFLLTHPKRNT